MRFPLALSLAVALAAPHALCRAGDDPEMGSSAAQIKIDPIHVSGLGTYGGKHLSAFYVSAREGMGRGSLNVRAIKFGPVTVEIPRSGEAQVPAVAIQKRGLETVNYVVLVVHDQQRSYLRNPDGSYPRDARGSDAEAAVPEDDVPYVASKFIGLIELGKARAAQGGPAIAEGLAPIRLDFQSLP